MEQEDISRELLGKIIDGEISRGTLLPPEEKLARSFDVSRMKLHRALDVLRENGVSFSPTSKRRAASSTTSNSGSATRWTSS